MVSEMLISSPTVVLLCRREKRLQRGLDIYEVYLKEGGGSQVEDGLACLCPASGVLVLMGVLQVNLPWTCLSSVQAVIELSPICPAALLREILRCQVVTVLQ